MRKSVQVSKDDVRVLGSEWLCAADVARVVGHPTHRLKDYKIELQAGNHFQKMLDPKSKREVWCIHESKVNDFLGWLDTSGGTQQKWVERSQRQIAANEQTRQNIKAIVAERQHTQPPAEQQTQLTKRAMYGKELVEYRAAVVMAAVDRLEAELGRRLTIRATAELLANRGFRLDGVSKLSASAIHTYRIAANWKSKITSNQTSFDLGDQPVNTTAPAEPMPIVGSPAKQMEEQRVIKAPVPIGEKLIDCINLMQQSLQQNGDQMRQSSDRQAEQTAWQSSVLAGFIDLVQVKDAEIEAKNAEIRNMGEMLVGCQRVLDRVITVLDRQNSAKQEPAPEGVLARLFRR